MGGGRGNLREMGGRRAGRGGGGAICFCRGLGGREGREERGGERGSEGVREGEWSIGDKQKQKLHWNALMIGIAGPSLHRRALPGRPQPPC